MPPTASQTQAGRTKLKPNNNKRAHEMLRTLKVEEAVRVENHDVIRPPNKQD